MNDETALRAMDAIVANGAGARCPTCRRRPTFDTVCMMDRGKWYEFTGRCKCGNVVSDRASGAFLTKHANRLTA